MRLRWRAILVLAVTQAIPLAANSSDCSRLEAKLRHASHSARPLMASPQLSFKSLFDECDQHDTYAGQPLPRHQGQKESCKIDPNRAQLINRLNTGAIHIRAKAAVDADGAPVACGPQRSTSDQCQTWLRYDYGSERYVNAEEVPYIVIPSPAVLAGHSFEAASGIQAGDLAVIIYRHQCVFGIVADSGPYFRIGEASIAVHEALGNPQCERAEKPCTRLRANGLGIGLPSGVDYLIFPGTRPAGLSATTIVDSIRSSGRALLSQFLE